MSDSVSRSRQAFSKALERLMEKIILVFVKVQIRAGPATILHCENAYQDRALALDACVPFPNEEVHFAIVVGNKRAMRCSWVYEAEISLPLLSCWCFGKLGAGLVKLMLQDLLNCWTPSNCNVLRLTRPVCFQGHS